ncbi:MAG TPA: FtsW/RodA/SpoVE family cell cycle protein [Candidatus Paceibacterota bacterium]|nr:FtsW/RodA/SpoVE family cell cycle protein [Candidatus Paceibacterota bacterium]
MDLRSGFKGISTSARTLFGRIDLPLLIAVALLGAISVLNLYGIGGADHSLFQRQIVLVVLGLVVLVVTSTADYRALKSSRGPVLILYGISIVLLASTLWFAQIRNIRAWIVIGGVQFEPSELAKLALVILMAKYFSQRHVHIKQVRHIVASGIYCAVPAVIVLMQPDLGSAAIIAILWFVMLLSVGINKRHLFLLLTIGVIGSYLAWIWALAPYQKDRILAFIDPYKDPSGYGYHIIQSRTAIGSGGLWGAGLGKGSQATLGFLPEPYNDFAFAALAEQFGLAGVVVVMGLIWVVVWRVLRIGSGTSNNFARLFCVGVATFIGAHVFISASVNIGLLPITGIPFSLLSYGGSHLLSLSVTLGIVQSIARHG